MCVCVQLVFDRDCSLFATRIVLGLLIGPTDGLVGSDETFTTLTAHTFSRYKPFPDESHRPGPIPGRSSQLLALFANVPGGVFGGSEAGC